MLSRTHLQALISALTLALLFVASAAHVHAQEPDELGDEAGDPVKLFHRGQNAHAKKDYEQALEFYEEALKLKPDFPEAEYQRGGALLALKRLPEAERALRRAMELRPQWALPVAALGLALAREANRTDEGVALLRRALALDEKNQTALIALAELRTRAGDAREAAALWRRATEVNDQDAALWVARASAERASGDAASALKSFERALALEPANVEARLRRAELYIESGDATRALEDLRPLEPAAARDAQLALSMANLYGRMNRREDAARLLDALPEAAKSSAEAQKIRAALNARCEDTPETRATLERLVANDARNASAFACLGTLLRTSDPARALDYFRRAAEIEPRNADYVTGYAAALIQLRRFDEAASILQRVVQVAPDNYAAHANFATALYELKLYKQALVEYKWITEARPDLGVVYYFIGTAHDNLGEYRDALSAYEKFLVRADPEKNRLEIDKVNLRLPSLRRQVERGEGVKNKKKG